MAEPPGRFHPTCICRYVHQLTPGRYQADEDQLKVWDGLPLSGSVSRSWLSSRWRRYENTLSLIIYTRRQAHHQLLGDATEQLSMKLGQTVGGLLNAT